MFQSSLEETPEWNNNVTAFFSQKPSVSILTRGKPRVEPPPDTPLERVESAFQSSLEENPEWNLAHGRVLASVHRFNPHSRKTPSGTRSRTGNFQDPGVSILTRGKPRVEPKIFSRINRLMPSFNPHSRKTPSGTIGNDGVVETPFQFQSSLEENPEWNTTIASAFVLRVGFNPHSRKTPSGTGGYEDILNISFVSILTRGKPRVEPQ